MSDLDRAIREERMRFMLACRRKVWAREQQRRREDRRLLVLMAVSWLAAGFMITAVFGGH